jgi:hypothetical protein
MKNVKVGTDDVVVEKKEKRINIKEIELEKLIKSFENSIKKSTDTLIKFNQNNSLKTNYINMRNELFTKDVLKKKILIDSYRKTSGVSNSEYNVKLSDLSETFKNVIGFRMIECSIPITSKVINDNNNKISISIDIINPELGHDFNGPETIQFVFTQADATDPVSIGQEISTTIRDRLQQEVGGSITINKHATSSTKEAYEGDAANNDFRIFDIVYNEITTEYEVYIWNFNNVTLTINFASQGNSFYRLLGYDKKDISFRKGIPNIQPHHIFHHNYNYLDVVVDKIPRIACKLNTNGISVLDRVFLNVGGGEIMNYRVPESETNTGNYFYPISLDDINIKILTSDNEIFDKDRAGHNYFEFEITTLENTKLMN